MVVDMRVVLVTGTEMVVIVQSGRVGLRLCEAESPMTMAACISMGMTPRAVPMPCRRADHETERSAVGPREASCVIRFYGAGFSSWNDGHSAPVEKRFPLARVRVRKATMRACGCAWDAGDTEMRAACVRTVRRTQRESRRNG